MPGEYSVSVRLKADVNPFVKGMAEAAAAAKGFTKEINTSNDRTAWLTQGILAIAPAIAPLGAAAIPVFTGIATQMTVAGAAAGTLALAFHGIGGALTALNAYQLEPTAAHLAKLQETFHTIGPQGDQFVLFIDKLTGQFHDLQNVARAGIFPGVEDGITSMLTLMPQLKIVVGQVGDALGQLAGEAGTNLAGPKFQDFFKFLETDARPILVQMGHTVGNFADGLTALLVDFLPVSRGFSSGLESMSKSFADWAHGLDQTSGFQNFLAYIQQSGPQAVHFIGALADALVGIAKAAAPVGSVMLPIFTEMLHLFADLASTPLGSTLLALASFVSIYGRIAAIGGNLTKSGGLSKLSGGIMRSSDAAKIATPSFTQLGNAMMHSMHSQDQLNKSFSTSLKYGKQNAQMALKSRDAVLQYGRSVAPAAAQVALLGSVVSGLDKKMGLANTTSLALAGSFVAGGLGAALGAVAGFTIDLSHRNDDLTASMKRLNAEVASGSTDLGKQAADLRDLGTKLNAYQDAVNHPWSGGPFAGISQGLSNISELWTHAGEKATESYNAQSAGFDKLKGNLVELGVTLSGNQNQWFSNDNLSAIATQAGPAIKALGLTATYGNLTGDALTRANGAIKDWMIHADSAKGRTDAVATAMGRVGTTMLSASDAAKNLSDAMDALLSPNMSLTAATDAWYAGLRHLSDQLDKTNHSLVGQTDAAQKNRAALASQVDLLKQRVVAEVAAGQSSTKVTTDFRNMRQALIEQASAAGLNRKQVEALVNQWKLTPKLVTTLYKQQGVNQAIAAAGELHDTFQRLPKNVQTAIKTNGIPASMSAIDALQAKYGLTPKQVQTLVTLKNQAALAGIRAVAAAMNSLHDKTLTITTQQRSTGGHVSSDTSTSADGGTVHGPRHPYGDKMLYMLAPGEEIISNRYGQADQYRSDRAAGRIPGYADGGTLSTTSSSSGTTKPKPPPKPQYMGNYVGLDELRREAHYLKNELHDLAKQVNRATKEVDKDRAARNAIRDQRNQVASNVSSNFLTDLFAVPTSTDPNAPATNPWAPGATATSPGAPAQSDPLGTAQTDIANLTAYMAIISSLKKRGLKGAVFSQITTLAQAQQVAAMSDAQLGLLSSVYDQRAALAQQAGMLTGNAAYGAGLDKANEKLQKAVDVLQHTLEEQRAENQLLRQVEKLLAAAPKHHAQATASALNSTAASAHKVGKTKLHHVWAGR